METNTNEIAMGTMVEILYQKGPEEKISTFVGELGKAYTSSRTKKELLQVIVKSEDRWDVMNLDRAFIICIQKPRTAVV